MIEKNKSFGTHKRKTLKCHNFVKSLPIWKKKEQEKPRKELYKFQPRNIVIELLVSKIKAFEVLISFSRITGD